MGQTRVYDQETGELLGFAWPEAEAEFWNVEDKLGNRTTRDGLQDAIDWLYAQRQEAA